MKNLFITIMLFLVMVTQPLWANKHPRVIEVESNLTAKTMDFLKARFPGQPFMVTISIDPLFRGDPNYPQLQARERLPYLELDENQLQDEWDAPDISDTYLLGRVRQIRVDIALPHSIKDDDIKDIEAAVYQSLSLVPGRDRVDIQRKVWGQEQKTPDWNYWGMILSVIFVGSFFGLFLLTLFGVNRLGKAFRDMKLNTKSSDGSVLSVPTMTVGGGGIGTTEVIETKGGNLSGEFKMNDPVKLREIAKEAVQFLTNNPGFPELHDLLTMDSYGKENPKGLGALLGQFPLKIQKALFAFSFEDHWLEALTEPGELETSCILKLNSLVAHNRVTNDYHWNLLLINIWRINHKRIDFLKKLKHEEAMSILHHLPLSVAMELAREIFPGNWAQLLNSKDQKSRLPDDRIKVLNETLGKEHPVRNFNQIDSYRHEKEILAYLKLAPPNVEKEIYIAAPENSMIHRARPPFFNVLDAPTDLLSRFLHTITIEQWASSFFDLPKNYRREFDKLLTEKQRFLLIERLKLLDANPPSKQFVGVTREYIAKKFHEFNMKEQHLLKLHEQQEEERKKDESNKEKKDQSMAA